MDAGVGTLISFSTQPGNVALDGFGRNSPYAKALVKQFARSRSNISDMLIRVRRDVMSDTQRKQVPWEHSALTDQFYYSKPQQSNITGQQKPNIEKQAEIKFWKFVKSSNEPARLDAYLKRYPTGAFVPLAQALIEKLEKIAQKTAEANRKELELRQAELKKRRAQEAEKSAKQQEQQTKQLAALKKARDEAARAKQALIQAEKEQDAREEGEHQRVTNGRNCSSVSRRCWMRWARRYRKKVILKSLIFLVH